MASTIGQLIIELRASTDQFSKGVQSAKDLAFTSSSAIVDSFEKIGASLSKIKFGNFAQAERSLGIIAGVGGAAAAGIVAATLEIAKSTSEQAKQLDKLSQSYGVDIETLSALRVASKLSGVDLEQLTMGMGRLARGAAQAATTGTGPAATALTTLGVRATDASGKLRPMDSLLLELAAKFQRMPDGTTKTALAMELFGRSGAAMIPFLNQGSVGIQKMLDLSKQLGLTWSQEDLIAARQFRESIEILELKGQAFREQLAKGVIPALDAVADYFLKVDANGKSLAITIAETVGKAFIALAETIQAAKSSLDKFYLTLVKLAKEHPIAALTVMGPKARDLANLESGSSIADLDARIKKTDQDYDDLVAKLETKTPRWHPPMAIPGANAGGATPTITAPGDFKDINEQVAQLLAKADQLADKFSGDKLQGEIDALNEILRKMREIQAQPVGVLQADVNQRVNRVNTLIDELITKQKIIREQLAVGIVPGFAGEKPETGLLTDILKTPVAAPQATGEIVQQAELIRLREDANLRQQESIRLFTDVQTVSEKYAHQIEQLDILRQHQNITEDTYNRNIEQLRENISSTFDVTVQYQKEIDTLNDSLKSNLLTETARLNTLKQIAQLEREKKAAETFGLSGAGAGIQAGLGQVANQWQGIGLESMHATTQALGGMEHAFANFFTEIASGTKTIGQAFADLGRNMLASIVNALAQMLARWIATKIAMAAVNLFGGGGDDAAAQATKKIAANVAIAQSDAGVAGAEEFVFALEESMGDIPYALAMAAIATSIGMGFAGVAAMAEGGHVPGVGSGDTVPAMLTPGEFVLTKDTVQRIGVPTLHAMNQGAQFAMGGMADSSMTQHFANGGLFNSATNSAAQHFAHGGTINSASYHSAVQHLTQGGIINSSDAQHFSTGGIVGATSHSSQFAAGGIVNAGDVQHLAHGGIVSNSSIRHLASGGIISHTSQPTHYAIGGIVNHSDARRFAAGGMVKIGDVSHFAHGGLAGGSHFSTVAQHFAKGGVAYSATNFGDLSHSMQHMALGGLIAPHTYSTVQHLISGGVVSPMMTAAMSVPKVSAPNVSTAHSAMTSSTDNSVFGNTLHVNVQGAGDANEVADRVMKQVKTFFRSNGVMKK